MGKVISFFLILIAFVDSNWVIVEIDKKVTIKLPDNYMKIDTLGQSIYGGKTESSFITLYVSPKDIMYSYEKNEELIRKCDLMIDGMLSTFNDPKELLKVEYPLNGINSRKVEFRYSNGRKTFHCISAFFILDETPYTLIVQSEEMLECSKDFKRAASSIRLRNNSK